MRVVHVEYFGGGAGVWEGACNYRAFGHWLCFCPGAFRCSCLYSMTASASHAWLSLAEGEPYPVVWCVSSVAEPSKAKQGTSPKLCGVVVVW